MRLKKYSKLKNLFILDAQEFIAKNLEKDSSTLMMMEGMKRGHEFYVSEDSDLLIEDGLKIYCKKVVKLDYKNGYQLEDMKKLKIDFFDKVWLRKNPPFDERYLMKLNILEQFKKKGVQYINDPTAIKELNEKLTILNFPECIAPTIVTMKLDEIEKFFKKHKKIVIKGMSGFGGNEVIMMSDWKKDLVKLKKLSHDGRKFLMAQMFLNGVYKGDKRVSLMNGKVIGVLLRVPKNGFIAYTGAGAEVKKTKLNQRETLIAKKVGDFLRKKGIVWAGIDLIDGYLSEINVTSPSLLAFYNNKFKLAQEVKFWDEVERK